MTIRRRGLVVLLALALLSGVPDVFALVRGRPPEILEKYELKDLRYAGKVQQGAQIIALVLDPDGNLHRITVGRFAGKNYGEIVRITGEKIVLIELHPNGLGGWEEKEAVILWSGSD